MIRVVRAPDPAQVTADAILREVGSDLEPLTSAGRALGARAGARALATLEATGEMPVGGALITAGGELAASLFIHVVLRSADEPVSEAGIRRAFQNGLRQAAEWDVGTMAVLPLGTGAGNLDAEDSARIMVQVLQEHRLASPRPRSVLVLAASDYEEETFRLEAERAGMLEPEPAP
jgi:O-acetyl-ADP-ribose deacetylase (regulator of RNase III)